MTSQVFVPTVSAAGLLVLGHCISTLIQQPLQPEWIALAFLTLFTGALTIRIPAVAARLSVSETFVFASVLLFGPCAGTVTVAIEILIAIIVLRRKQKTNPLKIFFNVSSGALSIWLSGNAFFYLANIQPLAGSSTNLQPILIPLAVLSGGHFILNSGSIALALALERGESALNIWRTNFLGLSVNYFAGASLAALFVSYTNTVDLFAISVIVPLLLVSYLTFKTSLGRIEDATRHVEQIRHLYVSTIETLATAIDAKDQVTHGHIRRVQQLALALAAEIGVRDRAQLEALEAAALLHDTGKLVVPEHILNKPGKLTKGEFEKMKTHARVGAEILSSIEFPFPVVPIVRHHHENWDGSGYPDGLRGTDIPIGARILAVVDCFDALTSDRPYRPRMTTEDALRILVQRRGTMYDPLVVDTFLNNWQKLIEATTPDAPIEHDPVRSLRGLDITQVSSRADSKPPSNATAPLDQKLDTIIRHTSGHLAILFGIDRERDHLVSVTIRASHGAIGETITMPLGYGVSGWVAVNSSAIVNADPRLDIRSLAQSFSLVRVISVPVRSKGETVGVLSVYSTDMRGFSDDDREFLEQTIGELSASNSSIIAAVTPAKIHPSRTSAPTIH